MHILFVCTGNTCRSAMAEGFLRKFAADNGRVDLTAGSCGTGASSIFRVPRVVTELMAAEGIDMSGHRSTQVNQQLVDRAGLILVMEDAHREYVTLCFPETRGKVFLLRSYTGDTETPEIEDPIGHSSEFYAEVAERIKTCVKRLVLRYSRREEALV